MLVELLKTLLNVGKSSCVNMSYSELVAYNALRCGRMVSVCVRRSISTCSLWLLRGAFIYAPVTIVGVWSIYCGIRVGF